MTIHRHPPAFLLAIVLTLSAVPAISNAESVGSGQSSPAVAEVRCSRNHTRLATPVVAVQPDGPHVRMTNVTGAWMNFEDVDGGGWVGTPAGVTRAKTWATTEPGIHEVRCVPRRPGTPGPETVTLEVVDPGATWHDPGPTCPDVDDLITWWGDYGVDAKGEKGKPAELLREIVHRRIEDTDIVEYAGYPEPTSIAQVWVIREDAIVMNATFERGTRGWLLSTTTKCASF